MLYIETEFAMNIDDLTKLSFDELTRIKNKNFHFFKLLVGLDLVVFYHSLFKENWLVLFLSFAVFVAGLSLYDNYKISKALLEQKQS
jgi:hypothetical protein